MLKSDTKCTACHDEADAPELLAIGKTRHGTAADARTPTCTKCHGESEAYLLNALNTKIRPKPDFNSSVRAGSIFSFSTGETFEKSDTVFTKRLN